MSMTPTKTTDVTIQKVGSLSTRLSKALTTTTLAYSLGDNIGGLLTLTNAVLLSAGGGIIQNVGIYDAAAQSAAIDVVFFVANPSSTTFTDNGALTVNAADGPSIVGIAHVTDWSTFAASSFGQALNLGINFDLSIGTSLYVALISRGTPTYATNSLTLNVEILPN